MSSPSSPPDPLEPVLARWTATPAEHPEMFSDVRRRIADHASGGRRRPGVLAAIDSWFARPSFALLFLLCCALVGLYCAEIRVNRVERQQSAQLARSYLELIDPLLTAADETPSHR